MSEDVLSSFLGNNANASPQLRSLLHSASFQGSTKLTREDIERVFVMYDRVSLVTISDCHCICFTQTFINVTQVT